MSATYNWSYRPNVTNKYGFDIPNTPDDIRPQGYAYIALFGNDSTGNGSRQHPFKTFSGATNKVTGGGNINAILASGVYREIINSSYLPLNSTIGVLIGDGDVIIDETQVQSATYRQLDSANTYNIKYRNCVAVAEVFSRIWRDSIIENTLSYQGYNGTPNLRNCIFNNVRNMTISSGYTDSEIGVMTNNTWYKSMIIIASGGNNTVNGKYAFYSNIFSNCNIWFELESNMDYTIFHNCKFKFGGSRPSLDNEFTSYNTITDLQDAQISAFNLTSPGNNFGHCIMEDPLFNNPSIGDFTLQYNSPGKNLSYSGSNVGAMSIGFSVKASGTASQCGFDLSTSVNLNISEDSITLVDDTQDAQIESVVIPNLIQREISKFPSFGFNADRNGQYIDTIADMATQSISPGTILNYPASYIIESGSIDYNNNPHQPGERFTTATASTTFTTSAGGTVREILEAPQRHTIMARFGNGDSQPITSSTSIVSGYWYYVSMGTITHNGVVHGAGDVFKAVNTSFSGSGTITLAMSNEVYNHYEPGIRPTTNNVGNSRSGEILRGNGDPNYERGTLNVNEFPINSKYVQIKYMIKVNNLKP